MAAFDREFLLQAEGVQAGLHVKRQNRSKFRRHGLSLGRRDKLSMNLNKP
jgi:hypothetical protein